MTCETLNVALGNEISSNKIHLGFVTSITNTLSGKTVFGVLHRNHDDEFDWFENYVTSKEVREVNKGNSSLYKDLPTPEFNGLELGFKVKDLLTNRVGILTAKKYDHYGRSTGTLFFKESDSGNGLFEEFPIKNLSFIGVGVYEEIKRAHETKVIAKPGTVVRCRLRNTEVLIMSVSETTVGQEVVAMYVNDKGVTNSYRTFPEILDFSASITPKDLEEKVESRVPKGCSIIYKKQRNIHQL
ncbi:hypothetical protein F7U66_00565 [Vibrio parahaemolyticus]|nr:hypothetical protein [Vibrio parahaemolyticus]